MQIASPAIDELFEHWLQFSFGTTEIPKNFGPDYQAVKSIQAAREFDPTGLGMVLKIQADVQARAEAMTVPFFDAVYGLSEATKQRMLDYYTVEAALERMGAAEELEGFRLGVEQAIRILGAPPEAEHYQALLDSPDDLVDLRVKAQKSFDTLRVLQFSHGTPSEEPVQFSGKVWEFWNIASLLEAMQAETEKNRRSVSLCLIRDPAHPLRSFFALAIVNGETQVVLTDKAHSVLPDHESFTRSPGKQFNRRAQQHLFPYELLNLEVSEDQRNVFAKKRDQLVRVNAKGVALDELRNLHEDVVVWLAMMFAQIRGEYLDENPYIGEAKSWLMLQVTTEPLSNVPAPVGGGWLPRPLLHANNVTEDDWKANGHNQWMIDRYVDSVLPEDYNPTMLPDSTRERVASLATVETDRPDPMWMGTTAELDANRRWIARKNQCRNIQAAADKEYAEKAEGILEWYRNAVRKRVDAIRDQMIRGPAAVDLGVDSMSSAKSGVLVSWKPGATFNDQKRVWVTPVDFCPYTGAKSLSLRAKISPHTGEQVAEILGVPFEELPWQIQQYRTNRSTPYVGNHLLQRVDPADWLLKNPWNKDFDRNRYNRVWFNLDIYGVFSKRGVNRKRKELGLDPVNWGDLD